MLQDFNNVKSKLAQVMAQRHLHYNEITACVLHVYGFIPNMLYSVVCVYSQFGSGYLLFVRKYLSIDKEKIHSVIPMIIGYFCPNWSGTKYP